MKCHKCGCKNFEAKIVVLTERPSPKNNGIWRCMECNEPFQEPKKDKEEKDANII